MGDSQKLIVPQELYLDGNPGKEFFTVFNNQRQKIFSITGDGQIIFLEPTSPTALVPGSSIVLSSKYHTLSSSDAAVAVSVTHPGVEITVELTLNATSSTWTFPVGSLCVSEGVASGDNTLSLAGASGDKYIISIKKFNSQYYVVSKNFEQ